jgi:hypothetical protein
MHFNLAPCDCLAIEKYASLVVMSFGFVIFRNFDAERKVFIAPREVFTHFSLSDMWLMR